MRNTSKLTIADIADEMLKVFDLDDARGGLAMEELHHRVKAQETDPEVATKMLNEGFLAALRKSNEKEFREFARIKFESSRWQGASRTNRKMIPAMAHRSGSPGPALPPLRTASALMIPHRVHTMRGPNVGAAM